jgi:hypothetical protein
MFSFFPWRNRAALYLHFPCFDGAISGVLATLYLEKTRGWKFKTIQRVNYHQQKEWVQTRLRRRSAVVDFLYHPQAEFWADHHETSFLTEQLRADFEGHKNSSRFYDQQSGSCASLLWRVVGGTLGPDPRLEEMVRWAEKIDSAAYDSVEEAFSNSHPALVLSRSLAIDADQQYCEFLVTSLRHVSLEDVVQTAQVQQRFLRAQELSTLGLERVRQSIRLEGSVAVFEASNEGVLMNRYSPYYFYPEAKYSISITHSRHSTKVTAMRNPWLNFESVHLGEFMRKFGGGGHQRVGALVLPQEREAETGHVVKELLQEMTARSGDPVVG